MTKLPGILVAVNFAYFRGERLIRSIEIIVIAAKPHLDFRYVVQFNMAVAKQKVHILEFAIEGMAAATAQRATAWHWPTP